MPPKKNNVKRGGSIASDAVMGYVPDNAYYVISNKNFFEGGASRRGGKSKRGGAATNAPAMVGRAEVPNIGIPDFPQANDRFDLSMVPQVQHQLAAQPFHTMNAIDRSIVYPNMPKTLNPIAFGGARQVRQNNNTKNIIRLQRSNTNNAIRQQSRNTTNNGTNVIRLQSNNSLNIQQSTVAQNAKRRSRNINSTRQQTKNTNS